MENFERFYFNSRRGSWRPPVRLSGIDFGPSSGPDLLLLHGMRDHALSMVSIVNRFAADYHITAPDLRGHGRSDNPGSYSMLEFVADLRSMTQARGHDKPFVLVGHSLGGHICLRFAALFPELVDKLVLLDGMGPPASPRHGGAEHRAMMTRESITSLLADPEPRVMRSADDALARLCRNNPLLSVEAARLIVDQGVEPVAGGGVRWRWDDAASMVWQTFSHEESEQFCGLIECPVLIVTGEHSLRYWVAMRPYLDDQQYYEAELERKQKLFKNARHLVIPGAGHMLHYDEPGQVNEAIASFL